MPRAGGQHDPGEGGVHQHPELPPPRHLHRARGDQPHLPPRHPHRLRHRARPVQPARQDRGEQRVEHLPGHLLPPHRLQRAHSAWINVLRCPWLRRVLHQHGNVRLDDGEKMMQMIKW